MDLEKRKLAGKVLTWLFYAEWSLSLGLLSTMLSEDSNHCFHRDGEPSPVDVLELCQCLTTHRCVDEYYSKVVLRREVLRYNELTFAHSPVRHWLETVQHFPDNKSPLPGLRRGHEMIAETALSCVMHWQHGHKVIWGPLLEYSIRYCLHHARQGPSAQVKELATTLLDDRSAKFVLWRDELRKSYILPLDVGMREFFEKTELTALHFASMYCIHWAVDALLKQGGVEDTARASSKTALHVACFALDSTIPLDDSLETIQLLLAAGADVNALDQRLGAPLHTALSRSRSRVEVLLHAAAEVNAIGGKYGTALQPASYDGSTAVIKLLFNAGADVNAMGGVYGTALQAASYNGRPEVVRLLLNVGADLNAVGGRYGTALQAASSWRAE
jgi:ankyrin repeat protein